MTSAAPPHIEAASTLAVIASSNEPPLARKKDDLIREKAILLKEVQHRVANSLQIVASVLLQSARRVQSEEARGHLRNAHDRVISIAAVQRHLALSALGEVALRPYFIQLCESLGASMIHDPERLSVVVTVDDSVVDANASASLGLIITELFRKNCVILVVEDIPLIRMGAVDLLVVDAGFEVLEAGSADEAIRILEARPDIHLVFISWRLARPSSMKAICPWEPGFSPSPTTTARSSTHDWYAIRRRGEWRTKAHRSALAKKTGLGQWREKAVAAPPALAGTIEAVASEPASVANSKVVAAPPASAHKRKAARPRQATA
jgi:hypothetical protein